MFERTEMVNGNSVTWEEENPAWPYYAARDTHSNSPTHQTLKSKWKQELCSCNDFPMQQVIGALLVMRCTLVATWHGEKADGITRGEDLH